jgi:hypothetical protein
MEDGFWPVVAIIAVVILYVLAKVLFYVRRSEEQWSQVDKSKLRAWEDDDD